MYILDYVKKHRRKDKKTAESKLVAAAKDIWRETDKKVFIPMPLTFNDSIKACFSFKK